MEETRLFHEHDRIANPDCPCRTNGRPHSKVIVVLPCDGTENPQVACEIGLLMHRHGAADRWPHLRLLSKQTLVNVHPAMHNA